LDGALAIIKEHDLQRIALIHENTVFPRSVARGVIESAPKMGLEIIFHKEWKKGTEDFLRLLQAIKALEPEVLLTAGFLEEGKPITRQLKELDFMPKLYVGTSGVRLDDFGATLGPDAEYVLGFSDWEPYPSLGLPGMQPFIEDFQKEFGRLPSGFAARGYAAGQALEAAVMKVESLDREKIRDTLARLDMVTVYGRYKVDKDGLAIGHETFLIQWQKGKKEIVWPEAYATAKLIFPIPPWSARK
jgi:branched-chain amino acid transport system substrate-binding protein